MDRTMDPQDWDTADVHPLRGERFRNQNDSITRLGDYGEAGGISLN